MRKPPLACTRSTDIAVLTTLSSRSSADLVEFLLSARAEGKRVVGYGAPGKGNTLLNHCGNPG